MYYTYEQEITIPKDLFNYNYIEIISNPSFGTITLFALALDLITSEFQDLLLSASYFFAAEFLC